MTEQIFPESNSPDFIDSHNLFSLASSKYYSSDQFSKNYKSSGGFSILHVNIRSLKRNFDQLKFLLFSLNYKFSVIALSETWLKTSATDYWSLPGYELVVNNRQGKIGGGVALYVRSELKFKIKRELTFSEEALETLFIEICYPKVKNILTGVVYKPPQVNHNSFAPLLQRLLFLTNSKDINCFISGDFNINLLDYMAPNSQAFIDITTSYSFLPLINKPTRITSSSATIIDNILSNRLPSPNSGIIYSDISDHLPIFMIMPNQQTNHDSFELNISFRKLTHLNMQKLIDDLRRTD